MIAVPSEGGPASAPSHGRALVPFTAAGPAAKGSRLGRTVPLRTLLIAGMAGLAAGTSALAAYEVSRHLTWPPAGRTEATAQVIHRLEEQVARLQGSVEALRAADTARGDSQWHGLAASVEAVKRDVEQVRSTEATTVAALTMKIDKADRDPMPKLADIAARLDRIEHDGGAPVAEGATDKLADLSGRLERLERQAGAAVVGPAAGAAHGAVPPGPTPSPARAEVTRVPLTPAKAPDTAPPALTGWVLRDVYDGMALVEARNGGLREVEPGEFLPGAGEVRSIERHGHAWVVLTSRGVIAAN